MLFYDGQNNLNKIKAEIRAEAESDKVKYLKKYPEAEKRFTYLPLNVLAYYMRRAERDDYHQMVDNRPKFYISGWDRWVFPEIEKLWKNKTVTVGYFDGYLNCT